MTNLTVFDLIRASQASLPVTFEVIDPKGQDKRVLGRLRIDGSLFYLYEDKDGSTNILIPVNIPEMFMALETWNVKIR